MRSFLARSTVAVLLATQFLSPAFSIHLQDVNQKKSDPSAQDKTPPKKVPAKQPSGDWQIGESLTIFDGPGADSGTKEPTLNKNQSFASPSLPTCVLQLYPPPAT